MPGAIDAATTTTIIIIMMTIVVIGGGATTAATTTTIGTARFAARRACRPPGTSKTTPAPLPCLTSKPPSHRDRGRPDGSDTQALQPR